MIKYARILNDETKLCEIGTGTNVEFYQSLGFTQQDVEQSDLNGQWYLKGYAPMKTDEQKAQEEIALIKGQLSELDSKAIRPLRAIMSGDYNTEDKETLNSIEEEAKRLREKILTLKNE